MSSTSDPDSWIEAAIKDLQETLAAKNEDYRISGEFSNFEFAASAAGIEVSNAITSQLAIKLGRIRGLTGKVWVSEESIKDSYKDLAGYAIILYAYALSLEG